MKNLIILISVVHLFVGCLVTPNVEENILLSKTSSIISTDDMEEVDTYTQEEISIEKENYKDSLTGVWCENKNKNKVCYEYTNENTYRMGIIEDKILVWKTDYKDFVYKDEIIYINNIFDSKLEFVNEIEYFTEREIILAKEKGLELESFVNNIKLKRILRNGVTINYNRLDR